MFVLLSPYQSAIIPISYDECWNNTFEVRYCKTAFFKSALSERVA